MLYKKYGLPEEDEIVLCEVTSVRYNSVFARLEEYGKSGMIHISEISPGRIRNIRDYVVEGKKIVCKVLRIDKERGNIDLSLRRVNENQRKKKINELKQQQKAEKILEFVAKQNKHDLKDLYDKVVAQLKEYENQLYPFFYDLVEGKADIKQLNLSEKLGKDLFEAIHQRIKKAEVEIKGALTVRSPQSNGVEIIRDSLENAEHVGNIEIRYAGAGTFSVSVTADEYKSAEKTLKKVTDAITTSLGSKGTAEFRRIEK